jgi:hypothetical protein
MPYPILDGSLAQITLEGVHDNQQVMNVFTYKVKLGVTAPDGQALLRAFMAQLGVSGSMADLWKKCIAQVCTILPMKGQWIHGTRFAYITDNAFAGAGALVGPSMPSTVSVAITRSTDMASRQSVGTVHMPAVSIANVTEGQVNVAGLALYNAFGQQSIMDVSGLAGGAVFQPVHFHRSAPDVTQPLSRFQTRLFVRTMHRRTVGLGT